MSAFNSFDNINFSLVRSFPYQQEGRYQTEAEADKVHEEIMEMVEDYGIKIDYFVTGSEPEVVILDFLKLHGII